MLSLGMEEEDGSSRVLLDFLCGAWGGRPDADGLDGASALGANLANVPVEELEANFPVRYLRYGFVPGSGGDGGVHLRGRRAGSTAAGSPPCGSSVPR